MPTTEDWQPEWREFLETIRRLVNQTDPDKTEFPVETGGDPRGLGEITNQIIQDLLEEDAVSRVTDEFKGLDPRVQRHLLNELQMFNAATDPDIGVGDLHTKSEATQLDKAATVKDSVKSILPLPKWIDRILEILDEIINLIT